jgi:hypothetical protein
MPKNKKKGTQNDDESGWMKDVKTNNSGYDCCSTVPTFGLSPGNTMPTRMCDFRLCTGDIAMMDWVLVDECVSLKAVSFDGYGYCNCDAAAMNTTDSSLLVAMVRGGRINQDECRRIVTAYVCKHKDSIWEDALKEYSLIE